MFWRRKKTAPITPDQWREVGDAIVRANLSLVDAKARVTHADSVLCEYVKADPFGAQLFESMRGKNQ